MAEIEEKVEDVLYQDPMEKHCSVPVAHDLSKKARSADVIVEGKDSDVDFNGLHLSEDVVKGLKNCGFEKPSPVQVKAIPLGRLGFDLLLQAKSGTGKTCVFSVISLERVDLPTENIQVMVLCPSREIAYQSKHVIKSIGIFKSGLKVKTFIGGRPLEKDLRKMKDCHIALGTPGRIAHLLRDHEMDLSSVRVFVLDEADKLLDDSFFVDLKCIYDAMPSSRQVVAVSATYPNGLDHFILRFMNTPIKVQLDVAAPVLLAVEQFAVDVRAVLDFKPQQDQSVKMEDISMLKLRCLQELIRRAPFSQGIIFSQYQLKAERVYDELRCAGVDVVLMSGAMSQKLRLESLDQFQQGKCRLMVATDLVSRGIDCESVDLVINFECPQDISTYIHRMGRAGRFGSFGSVVTLLGFHNEWTQIVKFQGQVKLDVNLVKTFQGLDAIGNPKSEDGQSKQRMQPEAPASVPAERKSSMLSMSEAFDLCLSWGKKNRIKACTSAWGLTIDENEANLCMEDPCNEWKIIAARKQKREAEALMLNNESVALTVTGTANGDTPAAGTGIKAAVELKDPFTSGYTFTSELLQAKPQQSSSGSTFSVIEPIAKKAGNGRVLSQGIRGGRGGGIIRSDLINQRTQAEGDSDSQSFNQ